MYLTVPCLSDLVLLILYIIISTSTVHTSIRTDTPTRLPVILPTICSDIFS